MKALISSIALGLAVSQSVYSASGGAGHAFDPYAYGTANSDAFFAGREPHEIKAGFTLRFGQKMERAERYRLAISGSINRGSCNRLTSFSSAYAPQCSVDLASIGLDEKGLSNAKLFGAPLNLDGEDSEDNGSALKTAGITLAVVGGVLLVGGIAFAIALDSSDGFLGNND